MIICTEPAWLTQNGLLIYSLNSYSIRNPFFSEKAGFLLHDKIILFYD